MGRFLVVTCYQTSCAGGDLAGSHLRAVTRPALVTMTTIHLHITSFTLMPDGTGWEASVSTDLVTRRQKTPVLRQKHCAILS
jgi:hypothetical protein